MTRALRGVGTTTTLDESGTAESVSEPTPEPASPDPIPPSPGGTPPTYPDDMPEPGALALDSGPDGEGAASGTLTVQPSYALPVALAIRTSRFESLYGYTEGRPRSRTSRHGIDCTWAALSQSDYETVRDLLRASSATIPPTPFSWTPPGESAGTWLVVGEPRYEQLLKSKAWQARATLVRTRT